MNVFLKTKLWLLLSLLLPACATSSTLMVDVQRPTIPVLTLKRINPTIRIDVRNPNGKPYTIRQMELSLEGTTQPDDIISIGLYGTGKDGMIDTSRVIYPMASRTLNQHLN